VQTLLLGGYVRREAPDLHGALTESNLEALRADIAFIGADGIDENGSCYNASLTVARMLGKMIRAAQRGSHRRRQQARSPAWPASGSPTQRVDHRCGCRDSVRHPGAHHHRRCSEGIVHG
jgi:hypothetical protein